MKICTGYVDNELLHWLESCIIGTCKGFQDPTDIANDIQKSGKSGFSVKRISGRNFLVSVPDRKFYEESKGNSWCWLTRWFDHIQEWFLNAGMN